MGHIRYLSHENREGRLPGTRGSKDVIAYLIKNLKSYCVRPAFGKSYTQPFNIQTGIQLGPLNNVIINNIININKKIYEEDLIKNKD